MTRALDVEQWRDELVDACKYGEEARARALVLRPGPRKARGLLEAMLEDPEALVRRAAAFALGELGGAASVRCLEQQLAREEARGDYDGASVVEAITEALGRLEAAGARAALVRRLQRLAPGKNVLTEVNPLARALWRNRHAELLPLVRATLERLALVEFNSLHGLLLLLERTPEQLRAWAEDTAVPMEHKTEVLTVLEEEVPQAWVPTLSTFISVAHAWLAPAVNQDGEAANYCERLLILLLIQERLLSALPAETLSTLRTVTRGLLAATSLNCSMRAADMLGLIGRPEDAELLEVHRPAEEVLARAFDEVAQLLRRQGD